MASSVEASDNYRQAHARGAHLAEHVHGCFQGSLHAPGVADLRGQGVGHRLLVEERVRHSGQVRADLQQRSAALPEQNLSCSGMPMTSGLLRLARRASSGRLCSLVLCRPEILCRSARQSLL